MSLREGFTTGSAATAAAMAAAGDGIVWNVDVSRLQRTLAAQGAYLEL